MPSCERAMSPPNKVPTPVELERVEAVSQAEAIARLLLNPGSYAQREDDPHDMWLRSTTLQRDDGTEYVSILDQDGEVISLEFGDEAYWYILQELTELESLERKMQKLKQRIAEIKGEQQEKAKPVTTPQRRKNLAIKPPSCPGMSPL